ncbi:MAG: flagellin [Pseudomonadota bacterium]
MIRFSNIAQYQLTNANILRTQTEIAETQIQIASGKKAQTYSEIATDVTQLVSLERSLTRSDQYTDNIDTALSRLNLMESSVGTLVERSTEVLGIIAQGLSGTNLDDLPLQQFANTFLAEAAGELNKQNSGFYIFGGSRTNIAPVDLSDTDYTPQAGLPGTFTADTDYYQGDDFIYSVRADDRLETSYGVTADHPTFEALLRGLSYMEYAGANSDKVVLEEAYDLLKSAIDGLSDLRGEIGSSAGVLEQQKTSHEDFQTFAENLVSNIEDVDIAQATTELSFNELQLQGSYAALARIRSLNLLQYLN